MFLITVLTFFLLTLDYVLMCSDEEIIDLVTPETSPSRAPADEFVPLEEMPSDVSSPEGENFMHTSGVIQSRIQHRCEMKVDALDGVAAYAAADKAKKIVVKKKRSKKRGHNWSKKGSKQSRRQHRSSCPRAPALMDNASKPTYYFTTHRIGPCRAREVTLDTNLGASIHQMIDWINSDQEIHVESQCTCPHCPYSTGDLHLQRTLLLQRMYIVHNYC